MPLLQRSSAEVGADASTLDVARVRADFPVLDQQLRGRPLVYLDSAASAQKPRQVVEALSNFYLSDFANIHRGVHTLSVRATEAYEQARLSGSALHQRRRAARDRVRAQLHRGDQPGRGDVR